MRRKSSYIILYLIIWAILTILAVTWGTRYDWPDNVHVDYGFPLAWSTHTLSTMVGSVDLWTIDFTILAIDLILWLGIMLIITSALLYFANEKNSNKKKE